MSESDLANQILQRLSALGVSDSVLPDVEAIKKSITQNPKRSEEEHFLFGEPAPKAMHAPGVQHREQ